MQYANLADFKRRLKRRLMRIRASRAAGMLAILLVVSLIIFSVSVYRRAVPIAELSAETVARAEIERIVLEAAGQAINGTDGTLYFEVRDSDGKLVTVENRGREVSALCSAVVSNINDALKKERYIKIKVPLGSTFKSAYLHGRGPCVSVRAVPYVAAYADVHSSFTEAGINQTLYSLTMTVTTDVTLVCSNENIAFTTSCDVTVAEEIIIGNVPSGVFK